MTAILCSSAVVSGHSRGGQTALVVGVLLFGIVGIVVRQEKHSVTGLVVEKYGLQHRRTRISYAHDALCP